MLWRNPGLPATRLLIASLSVLTLAGCGGPAEGPATEQAPKGKAVRPADARGASGKVTVCGPEDTGVFKTLTRTFNAKKSGVTARYVELGADTDAARAQAIQRLEGRSSQCDMYVMDVTWVSEWAAQGWVKDQTALVEQKKDEFIPSTLKTAHYDKRYWAMPFYTNAGVLFYRSDRVEPPTTWKQVYKEAAGNPRNRVEMQGKQYEGLTVNFLELLYSAGGSVLDENGKVTVDSPETRKVLKLMADGVKSGAIDRASLTYEEDAARRVYESGAAGHLRGWPNMYTLLQKTAAARGTKVAQLPAFDEHAKPASVLGGWNLAVAASSKNTGAAVSLIQYATSAKFQKKLFLDHAQAPVAESTYEDPQVRKEIPFAAPLKEAVVNAKPRPKSPVYAEISKAVYSNVHAVLSGTADVDSAVRKMAEDINTAQKTF